MDIDGQAELPVWVACSSAFGALSIFSVQLILWEVAVGDPREICGKSMASSSQPSINADVDMPSAGGAGPAVDGHKVSWTQS